MTQQTATETCSCGATLTITTDLLAAAERALTTWRNTHKHTPPTPSPPPSDEWDGSEFTYTGDHLLQPLIPNQPARWADFTDEQVAAYRAVESGASPATGTGTGTDRECRDAIHTSQGVPLTGRHHGCTIHAGAPIGTPSVFLDHCLILPN